MKKTTNYEKALAYYQQLIDQHKDCIYIDEALFLALKFLENIKMKMKRQKKYYEKIILEHPTVFFHRSSNAIQTFKR